MSDRRKWGDTAFEMLMMAGLLGAGAYAFHAYFNDFMANLDPDKVKHDKDRQRAEAHLEKINQRKRLGKHQEQDPDDETSESRFGPKVEDLALNEYENLVALEMVAPDDIHVGFDDIGGLEMIIEELKESVIYPLTMPHLYSHAANLLSAPSGVLLFGPPGCGKTMLAKAVARESGASFINLHISTMTEKWYGDSNKIVRAVFSLARKMQPSIIFIDEIDAVLGTRRSGEHEASGMVKAEFMTLWDGLTSANATGSPAQICVLGATNRPDDIDEAILRRMPKKFPVSLPQEEQRRRILGLILKDSKVDTDHFNIGYIAKLTAGMSGSDIKEACRDAAMAPVREYMRAMRTAGRRMGAPDPDSFRGIRTDDFFGTAGGHTTSERTKRPLRKEPEKDDEYEDVIEEIVESQD